MAIDELEIRWRYGSASYTLTIDADGAPHLALSARPDGRSDPAPLAARPAPRGGPERRGKPWTDEEEAEIRASHEAGESAGAIAKALGRSHGAVQARLVKLGLISAEDAGLRFPVRPPADRDEP